MSCSPGYVFSIDGHDLTVIETEGTATAPVTVNSIHILAGKAIQLHNTETLLTCAQDNVTLLF
jgi:FtsP/CotA-like multicopper oxidase with cupredoxin domain